MHTGIVAPPKSVNIAVNATEISHVLLLQRKLTGRSMDNLLMLISGAEGLMMKLYL